MYPSSTKYSRTLCGKSEPLGRAHVDSRTAKINGAKSLIFFLMEACINLTEKHLFEQKPSELEFEKVKLIISLLSILTVS